MNYSITIQGRGGHGSRPDRAYNPIDCFAAVFSALQRLNCRITMVDGGTAANVIPGELIFQVEYCDGEQELIRCLKPICKLYHCSFEIEYL